MTIELYLTFMAATAILILIPGPNVTLIVASSLSYGARHALVTVAGTQAAQAVQLIVVTLGMTTVIGLLAQGFEWLRWAGVAYLLWLGVERWRSGGFAVGKTEHANIPRKRLFWQGFLVSATNPKVLFFYAAFFPQFVDPGAPAGPQLAMLAVTFMVIALLLDGGYALAAGRLRHALSNEARGKTCNRVAGSLLIGTGLWLALARRT